MIRIDESQTAKGYTPAGSVPAVFLRPRTLDGIVIHHWGARGQTHDDVVRFFVDGPGTTSAHFVVSAGRITCIVSPEDAAWHSGNAAGNASTIGIECRPEADAGDYAAVAELIRYLRTVYDRPLPLSPHRQWQATACPGVWDLERLEKLAGTTPAPTKGTPTMASTTPKTIAEAVWGARVQQLKADDKPGSIKPASWILGHMGELFGRVLDNQAAIRADLARIEAKVSDRG